MKAKMDFPHRNTHQTRAILTATILTLVIVIGAVLVAQAPVIPVTSSRPSVLSGPAIYNNLVESPLVSIENKTLTGPGAYNSLVESPLIAIQNKSLTGPAAYNNLVESPLISIQNKP